MEKAAEDISGDIIPILPNQVLDGMNTQPFAETGQVERHRLADQVYTLTEPNRPDEKMPIFEDEHGTYIMNSKDLRAVQHVAQLVQIGVNSLKIEGRTKSHYYVARTTQTYRQAIDDAVAGRPFDASLMLQLDALANRGYTDGFYTRKRSSASQNYETGNSTIDVQRFVGEVVAYDAETKLAEVIVKNKFSLGDSIELINPGGNTTFTLDAINDARYGNPMDVAPGSGHQVRIPLPVKPDKHALLAVNLRG